MKKLPGILIILALVLSPFILMLPFKDWLQQAGEIRQVLVSLGYAAPVLFFLVSAILTALGFPRLIFCSTGGWLFGFTYGFALSHFATLAGAFGMFMLARKSKPESFLNRYPKLKSLKIPQAGGGWWTVLMIRQLPIGGLYNDVLLGWSRVSSRDFWIGTFLGFLPQGITASLVGAGTIQADTGKLGAYLALAAVAFFVLNLFVKWLTERKNRLGGELA